MTIWADSNRNSVTYYKRDFWSQENLKFTTPHYRLRKSARLVNKLAGDRPCELLDVGCGPATLKRCLRSNISYYGIDMAIHEPAPYLLEYDILAAPIAFQGKRFDIVLAQGVFEYVGKFQEEKLADISRLLKDGGYFVVSYTNFDHRAMNVYWSFSNIQPLRDFRDSLARHFRIVRYFPVSYNWNHSTPARRLLQAVQFPMTVKLPVVSRLLGVEYFFVCTRD